MVVLDHHIVPSSDRDASAGWLAAILGLPAPRREGPFAALDLGDHTSLFFAGWDQEVTPQHYAFRVGPGEFDRIVGRLVAGAVAYWAEHDGSGQGTIHRDATGRSVYFRSPEGHLLEVLTTS